MTLYAKLYYSLGHSQGDGLMFEGVFNWKNYQVKIKQSGRYYHNHSKEIEIETLTGNNAIEGTYQRFEAIYQKICKELEKEGYSFIEDRQSEAFFIEECNANEWLFTKDGVMETSHE